MVTRERLIEASIDLFSHHGFDGTSLSAIAKEAGVTQPTLNYHFGTKRELYQDVVRHCGSRWVAAIEVGDDLRDLSKLDVLRVVLRRLGHVIVDQEVVTRLMLQASMHPEFEGEVEKAPRRRGAAVVVLSMSVDSPLAAFAQVDVDRLENEVGFSGTLASIAVGK